jgi:hypothetical protein
MVTIVKATPLLWTPLLGIQRTASIPTTTRLNMIFRNITNLTKDRTVSSNSSNNKEQRETVLHCCSVECFAYETLGVSVVSNTLQQVWFEGEDVDESLILPQHVKNVASICT